MINKFFKKHSYIRYFYFFFFFGLLISQGRLNSPVNKDITLLINQTMFNDLFSKTGVFEKKINNFNIKVSSPIFLFNQDSGNISIDFQVEGKNKIIKFKKTVKFDVTLKYNLDDNIIILNVERAKINFGNLIGDIDFYKLVPKDSYTFSVPEFKSESINVNGVFIKPEVIYAEAVFISDAIKIAYDIEYR
ncbi:MAG: hypothetical protein CMG00_07300 [Candidatus Marinimicrobia bacterium]|nr:hypothetical protein [Candidatus Neomarinimicrobiota bacterium]